MIDTGHKLLKKRHRAERRFRLYGVAAIALALIMLGSIFVSLIVMGHSAFRQTEVSLPIVFDADIIYGDDERTRQALYGADYQKLARTALRKVFPDVNKRRDKKKLNKLLSPGAGFELRDMVLADPAIIGKTFQVPLPVSDDADLYVKGQIDTTLAENDRQLDNKQTGWIDALTAKGLIELRFNTRFFTGGDSREPEMAGILGAVKGSFYTLLVCFGLAFPIGVLSSIYLESFAPKNRFTDFIEININNLAAVPSIVFGLLGLAVFLNVLGLPRSAPLVGGMVLALMTLPTIIIAARSALKAVPPSIFQAALGLGATRMQAVFHHVLPLAMPGIMTGAIIGLAQALGETAPLLMIGMIAFIVDIPTSVVDPATTLPVQIYIWADSPERAFVAKTAAGILVLLAFLIVMNLSAVILRKKFERRW